MLCVFVLAPQAKICIICAENKTRKAQLLLNLYAFLIVGGGYKLAADRNGVIF
jgi:hypothetical protein